MIPFWNILSVSLLLYKKKFSLTNFSLLQQLKKWDWTKLKLLYLKYYDIVVPLSISAKEILLKLSIMSNILHKNYVVLFLYIFCYSCTESWKGTE